jgi:hypothetical protein
MVLFLAQTLLASGGCWTNGVDAFAFAFATPPVTNNGWKNIGHNHANTNPLSASVSAVMESKAETDSEKEQLVLVLGGSGYIGRRVCKELVQASSGDETTTRVVSISRNGKPPSWCLDDNGDSSVWAEKVEWIKHDIVSASSEEGGGESLAETLGSIFQATTTNESNNGENQNEASSSPWDTTIVGCIGNVNPTPSWKGLWGLAFDDDQLFEENGKVYELFLNETNSLRERGNNLLNLQRCVFLSIDYTCQKCLEGPIEGYVDGKRLAERRFLEAVSETTHGSGGSSTTNSTSTSTSSDDPSNLEKVVVIGLPNFVFGGKRFPGFGKFYRKLVESPPARAYVGGNQALRSMSKAAPEDWVEEMVRVPLCAFVCVNRKGRCCPENQYLTPPFRSFLLLLRDIAFSCFVAHTCTHKQLFSSPVDVEVAGKATAMAAKGLVSRDLVNNGEPRKQGFFNRSGLPVEYDDILFVDGTHEIEKLVGVLGEGDLEGKSRGNKPRAKVPKTSSSTPEPLWEGALIGKRPWLYPVPVTLFFVYLFWGIMTEQFVQAATGM